MPLIFYKVIYTTWWTYKNKFFTCKAACKRTQQLPTTRNNTQQLSTTRHSMRRANGRGNSQQSDNTQQLSTTRNFTRQHATGCANGRSHQQCCVRLPRGYVRWQKVATVHNFSNVWSTGKSGCLRLFSLQISVNIRESAMLSYNSVSKYWLALKFKYLTIHKVN